MVGDQKKTVSELGAILGIWAHPDDEAWSSAGLMRIAVENGQRVGVVTATRGEGGQTADQKRWPQEKLAAIRTDEMAACLASIGRIEHTWLSYLDGEMNKADQQQAAAEIAQIINIFKPDTVITFEKNGITGHSDHKTIHSWAISAVEQSAVNPLILCATHSHDGRDQAHTLDQEFSFSMDGEPLKNKKPDKVDLEIILDDRQLKQKIHTMRCHASQTEQLFKNEEHIQAVRKVARIESFEHLRL